MTKQKELTHRFFRFILITVGLFTRSISTKFRSFLRKAFLLIGFLVFIWNTGDVRNNTTLNILDNGIIDPGALEVYDTSIVNVLGDGAFLNILWAFGVSEINISNGMVGLNAFENSTVNVDGGVVRAAEGGTDAMG